MIVNFSIAQGQTIWVETTQEDFKDGTYERNLYASHRGDGAVEFAPRFDLNNDGYIDIITSEGNGPFVSLYWGGSSGYSPSNRTTFPTIGSAGCDIADLNVDGHADFVVSYTLGFKRIAIYWGSPTGPNSSNFTDLPLLSSVHFTDGLSIADFDKDGYLDIVCDQYQSGSACIFWGSPAGYDTANRTDLPTISEGFHNIEVADFDRNGWLDAAFVDLVEVDIFWGSPSGFSATNKTELPNPATPHGLSVADLNDDGFLDLVSTGYGTAQQFIYWGSASGYSTGNRQILNPGYSYGGNGVADINQDGFLDIIFYLGGGSTAQEIYWGSSTGYSDGNRTTVGHSLQTSGGFVADLNYDGHFDIFAHRWHFNSNSHIYWGPNYQTSTATALPIDIDHHGMVREIGNVYTREYEESYISSVFDAGEVADWGNISWVDSLPEGTAIMVQVRSGNTTIPDPSWSAWVTLSNGEAIPEFLNARYLQYQAIFTYTNPARLPLLYKVSITLTTGIAEGEKSRNLSKSFHLAQNYPNPFHSTTHIRYVLPTISSQEEIPVRLEIYDITGKLVETLVDERQVPGVYQVQWEGRDQASGIYFYRLQTRFGQAGDFIATRKMVLLR
ncbi:T9SS type A sorting domain-containing protein [candidate division TA06 bacterium]|nr:T9SS type A sorting domain-containing protein [candidate division TA06 bacterium]